MTRVRAWIPFSLLTAAIFVFSSDLLTGDRAYAAMQDALGTPHDDLLFHYGHIAFHKANHLLAFTLLGLFTFPLRNEASGQGPLRALCCCACVALGSELFQFHSNSRSTQVTDVAINLGASMLGLWLLFLPPAFLHLERRAFLRLERRAAVLKSAYLTTDPAEREHLPYA